MSTAEKSPRAFKAESVRPRDKTLDFAPPLWLMREIAPLAGRTIEVTTEDLRLTLQGIQDKAERERQRKRAPEDTAWARNTHGIRLHYLYKGSDAAFELWSDAWHDQPRPKLRRAWDAFPEDPKYGDRGDWEFAIPDWFEQCLDNEAEAWDCCERYFINSEHVFWVYRQYAELKRAWLEEQARGQRELDPAGFTVGALLDADTTPEDQLLVGGLSTVDIWQLYGPTGAGKTLLAMSLAMAVASGADFIGWQCNTPRRVLYLDGELPDSEVSQRLDYLLQGFSRPQQTLIRRNLVVVSREHLHRSQGVEMAPLDTEQGEAQLNDLLDRVEPALVVFDSRYCLLEADMMQQGSLPPRLLRRLRARKVAQLWLHHTGKDAGRGGYGDKTAEFLLDANLELTSGHALRFHKKRKARADNRTFYQDRALALVDGTWSATSPDNAEERADRLERLQQDLVDFPDDSERARADRLGLPKSTVHRLLESMQK